MALKEELLELAAAYDEIKNEAISAVNQVRSRATDFTDVQRLQYLLEKKDFNLKNNFLAVVDLAERHKITTSRLNQLFKKYQDVEKSILSQKSKLEGLGLNNIVLSPKALGAMTKNNTAVVLHINQIKKDVDIKIFPDGEENDWAQEFEKFAWQLKKDIGKVIN